MRRVVSLASFGAVCVLGGMLAGSCIERSQPSVATAGEATAAAPALPKAEPAIGTPLSFADLADSVKPAVVNISTTKEAQGRRGFDLEQIPEPFRDFFRRFGPPDEGGGGGPRQRQHSLGSGFVIDPNGLVVTNNHVVQGADEIQIGLADGTTLSAEVIGNDADTDLALIKVDLGGHEPLPYLEFGDSDAARVGEWVLAVGNPFGLDHTFTAGIISAKGRVIGRQLRYQDFLQTDASINPGNSGGPLIDLQGRVIGVNSAIYSRTGQSAGIGFAIPANLATFVIDQLRSKKKVVRGYLGVQIQPIDETIAEGLGLDEAHGALVAEVYEDTPAAKAGIEVGDVIVQFNGSDIRSFQELPLKVSTTPPGTKVKVVVLRAGERRSLDLVLDELPEEPGMAEAMPDDGEPAVPEGGEVLGMELRELGPSERKRLDLGGTPGGLVIEALDDDSSAAAAGLRPGDVILRAGQQSVAAPDDLETAVAAAKRAGKSALLLLIHRDGTNRFVGVDLP